MKKLIALLLAIALILPFVPNTSAETLTTEKTEILSKRDIYSKTYQLPDGSYQYVASAEPIHYKDSTGAYVEIDNKISTATQMDGYKYTNTANEWKTHFSEKLNNSNAVMMTSGAYSIAFSLVSQTENAPVIKSTALPIFSAKNVLSSEYYRKLSLDERAVVYADVADNVDIAYTVHTDTLKEDIILKSREAPNTYKFRLTTNGLVLHESNGAISLRTADGTDVFAFAPLYMEDSNGKRSENVSLTYVSIKNGYELTISADTDFLRASDTAYPVVIDPSIMVSGSSNTYDTCVDQQYPNSNYYLSESLWTGGADGYNAMRTYIKFNLPTTINATQVTSAYIYLLKKDYQNPTIRAHLVTEDWSSSSVTWNNKPAYNEYIYSSQAVNTVGNWYGLNITDILIYWMENYTFPNYGVVLKEPNENNSGQKTKFYSSDAPSPNKPELVINYITFGSRPYQETSRTDINCMGYALECPYYIGKNYDAVQYAAVPVHLNIVDEDVYGFTLSELQEYIQARSEDWMSSEEGIGGTNWELLQSYNSEIDDNCYRVVLRVGFHDVNNNEILDVDEEYDYHWWYQTDSGDWAEKQGPGPSTYNILTAGEDPTDFYWPVGMYSYDSSGVFYQIRDLRSVSWS